MAIDSEWEKFYGGPTLPTSVKFHATINRAGVILINSNLFRHLGRPLGVHLFFNRQRDQIGLQPTSDRLSTAFPVRQRGSCYQVFAAPFLRHFGIRIDATHRFILPEISADGRLVLKLGETVVIDRLRRKRKEPAK